MNHNHKFKFYYLGISYPGKFYGKDRDEQIEKLAKSFGGKEIGAGYGGGTRDVSLEFKKLENAEKFYKEARKQKLIYSKFYLSRVEEVIDEEFIEISFESEKKYNKLNNKK